MGDGLRFDEWVAKEQKEVVDLWFANKISLRDAAIRLAQTGMNPQRAWGMLECGKTVVERLTRP